MTTQSTIQNETESQIAFVQDMIQESQTEKQKEVVYAKGFRGTKIEFEAHKTDIAYCLTACREKGVQNLGENFVLCKKN